MFSKSQIDICIAMFYAFRTHAKGVRNVQDAFEVFEVENDSDSGDTLFEDFNRDTNNEKQEDMFGMHINKQKSNFGKQNQQKNDFTA